MKIKERKNILSSSNRRLVVMGRFNASDTKSKSVSGITFAGRADGEQPKLAVADLFEHISPELRYVKGESVRIGNTAFNSYKLKTPASAGGIGYGQAITADSPLLLSDSDNGNQTDVRAWQDAGGKLFQSLLADLDEVVKFSDGRFSAALLKLTRRYMVDYADAMLSDDKIDRADWEQLAFDHPGSSSILNYMTCYQSDESNARSQVAKALNAHAESEGSPLNGARVEQLLAGLQRCKRTAESGAEDDRFIQAIAKDPQYRYLGDYAGSKYGISIPGAGAKGFIAHYRYYIQKSNAVHRFVRNGSLHSYLFLFLAGKYSPYNSSEEFPSVAKEMYSIGVEGQGDKRVPGETAEERKRNFELVRDAESKVSDKDKAQLQESGIYEKMQQVLLEGILEKLRPERAFRREALNKRNRELFVFLGQMAGGKAGQILNQATDMAGQLSRIYRAAKNVRAPEGEILGADAYTAALKKLRTGEMSKFVDSLLEDVAKLSGEGEVLRTAVCETVVKRIAVETKTYFDQTWISDLDAIDQEVQALGDIYDLRNKVDVERREGASLGMPMTVLTDKELQILAPAEASAKETERYAKSLHAAAKAAGVGASGPATAPLSVPAALEASVKTNQSGVIKNAAGAALADLKADPDHGVITATLKAGADAGDLLSKTAVIEFGDLSSQKVVDIEGLDLQPLVASSEKKARHIEDVASKFGSYSETQTLLREKYVSDRSAKGDTPFTRAARALALGEYMAAAPPDESNLGIADLSNVMGIGLDMVEHIGETDDAKMFKTGNTLPPDVLARMNLSLHYPVNTAAELSSVLQYHHGQCEALGELGEYFAELRSLKNLFNTLEGTEAEITVYNTTLADHADRKKVRFARDLFVVKEHPLVAYFTAQAEPTPASISALGSRVGQILKRRTDDTATLQIPILLTPQGVSEEGSVFPVVSKDTFPLPPLVQAGTDAATDADVIPVSKAGVDTYLALAASLVVGAGGPELGTLQDIDDEQSGNLQEKLLSNPQEGQNVSELFREGWASLGSPLVAMLAMSKWVNICVLAEPQDTDTVSNAIRKNCTTILKAAFDKKAAADYLADSAFEGLHSSAFKDAGHLSPFVFDSGRQASSLTNQSRSIALAGGELGLRAKVGSAEKQHKFGELPFLVNLASLFAQTSDDEDE